MVLEFLSVADLRTFRAAILAAVQSMSSTAQLDTFIKAVTDGLKPEETSAYAWFEAGTLSGPQATPERAPSTYLEPQTPDPRAEGGDISPLMPQTWRMSGLLPPTPLDQGTVVRIRGLNSAQDPVHVSAALTLEFGVQVIVTAADITAGVKYVSVPESKFKEMFAPANTRRYHSTEHGWILDFESKQVNGEPFHLPLLSPTKAHNSTTAKRPRKSKAKQGRRRNSEWEVPQQVLRRHPSPYRHLRVFRRHGLPI